MANSANNPIGVREYVGARYVPLIAGEWDKTKAYEPLTIVTNEGNSYTSKQYVPVGVDITNQDYWVLTGNFNGGLANLTKNFNEFKTSTDQELTNLTEDLNQFKTSTDQNIENLQNKVKTEIVIIGDSYSAYDANEQQVVTSGAYLWTKIGSSLNLNVHNYANGGAGFINGSPTFINQLQTAMNDTSYEHSAVKAVVVYGGTNDYGVSSPPEDTAIISAIRALVTKYYTSDFYQNSVPLFIAFNSAGASNRIVQLSKFVWGAQNFESIHGVYAINLCFAQQGLGNSAIPMWCTDQVHPTRLGYSNIAQAFIALLTGKPMQDVPVYINDTDARTGLARQSNLLIRNAVLQGNLRVIIPANTTINTTGIYVGTVMNVGKALNSNNQWILPAMILPQGRSSQDALICRGIANTNNTMNVDLFLYSNTSQTYNQPLSVNVAFNEPF